MADDTTKTEETTVGGVSVKEEHAKDMGPADGEPMLKAKETKAEPTTSEADASPEAGKEKKEETAVVPAADDKSASDVDETIEVPKEFKKLVEEVEKMSVLQLNELVKVLEKRFGVSASVVAIAGGGDGDAGGEEEQSAFTVELAEVGESKIAVIKAVKEVCGLGLKEAKDLVDSAPTEVKTGLKKEEAEELKTKLEEAGATVNLK